MSELRGRSLPEPLGREAEYVATEDAMAEGNTRAQVTHGRAQGMGSAAFVLGMWEGLQGSGLTREETLALIQAALKG